MAYVPVSAPGQRVLVAEEDYDRPGVVVDYYGWDDEFGECWNVRDDLTGETEPMGSGWLYVQ